MTRVLHSIALSALLVALSIAHGAEPLKIGLVFNSLIGDAGWTYQHNEGRLAVEENLGDRVETSFLESVTESEVVRVLRSLIQDGHELIFTASFSFVNPTIKVAKDHPDVTFQHATGYKVADNVGVYHARAYEARYLSGIIAGKMSEFRVAGFIARSKYCDCGSRANTRSIRTAAVYPVVFIGGGIASEHECPRTSGSSGYVSCIQTFARRKIPIRLIE